MESISVCFDIAKFADVSKTQGVCDVINILFPSFSGKE